MGKLVNVAERETNDSEQKSKERKLEKRRGMIIPLMMIMISL